MKKILIASLALALLPHLAAAAPVVELVTNQGTIEITLDRAHAPKTVDNFVAYVKSGHYNGTIFHRVIDGFMIQGGGYDGSLREKPTRAPIANEAANGLKNKVGTIAMARTQDPDSASAQFFINLVDNPSLDYRAPTLQGWGYAVFGKVTRGMEVVARIGKTPTGSAANGMSDVPRTPVVIRTAIVKP
ncbi:peptidylprolyl isomerase [Paludibacterium yongneupense]|uniref:peptidylprolyl isomerase n=1 Tax=Paludibacterium yongneupense TaxID=400061 RepID=UPI0003FC8F89|nr:peptidylprolyl isomerase [Paludibacterium yongneupense]